MIALPKKFIKSMKTKGFDDIQETSDEECLFIDDDGRFVEITILKEEPDCVYWATGVLTIKGKRNYWSSGSDGLYFFSDFKKIIFG